MIIEIKVAKIAQRVRDRRKELGLSIREAAKLARISPSTIQKIESNEMIPSIAVLMKIAQGLKQHITSFFEDDGELTEIALTRTNNREVVKIAASKLKVEDLGSAIIDSRLDVTLLTIEKGGKSGKEPLMHEGEEIKFCLKGEIVFYIDGKEYRLSPGDCIHFKSNVPHYWRNLSNGITELLSVVYNPPLNTNGMPKKSSLGFQIDNKQ